MFFGIGIFPFKIAGDKNFVLDLSHGLSAINTEVTIISLNDFPISTEKINNLTFYNFKRPLHLRGHNSFYVYEESKIIGYRHKHSVIQENIELSISLIKNYRAIRKIIKHHNISVIHVFDNLGIAARILAKIVAPIPIVSSVYRYHPRSSHYGWYLSMGYGASQYIIANTEETWKLVKDNFSEDMCHEVIPWGITASARSNSEKKYYDAQKNTIKVLWTGFIQQIEEKDFYLSINIAQDILRNRNNFEFFFLFKPESFKEKYASLGSDRIHISKSDSKFREKLPGFDLLLCPTHLVNSTMAPPLTWIECWSYGIPVVTNRFLGAAEIIIDNVNGWVFSEASQIAEKLPGILDNTDFGTINKICKEHYSVKYNIKIIARNYRKVYEKINCQ